MLWVIRLKFSSTPFLGKVSCAFKTPSLIETNGSSINTGGGKLLVEGGELEVSFDKKENSFHDVFLKGPAKFVFKGNFEQ